MKQELIQLFTEHFGYAPAVFSRAPGRLEILGNHTDYNQGFVLSAAVGQATQMVMAKRDGRICRIINPPLEGVPLLKEKNISGAVRNVLRISLFTLPLN